MYISLLFWLGLGSTGDQYISSLTLISAIFNSNLNACLVQCQLWFGLASRNSYMKAHFEAVIICSSPIITQPALKWFGIFILLIWLDNWVLSMQLNGQFLGKVSYVQRLSIEYLVAPPLALLAHPWTWYEMLLNVGSGVRVHRFDNWVLSI